MAVDLRGREMPLALVRRDHFRAMLVIGAAIAALIVLYGRIDPGAKAYAGWDLHHYRAMAASVPGLNATVSGPYVYRVLGPYLAGLLPGSGDRGFYILALVFSLALAWLLYGFLIRQGIDHSSALITVILFLCNKYFFGLTLWDYFQLDDLLALVVLLAGLWTMLEGRWFLFALILGLGAMARETTLLLIPASLAYVLEMRKARTDLGRWVAAVVPGITAFLLLRFLVPTPGGPSLLDSFLINVKKLQSIVPWFGLTVNGLVPLSFLPLIFWRTTAAYFSGRLYLLLLALLIFVSALFGWSNERLMAPIFVVFYPLLAVIIRDCLKQSRTLIIIIMVGAVVSSVPLAAGRLSFPSIKSMLAVTLSSLTVVSLAAWWHRRTTTGNRPNIIG